MNPFYLQVAERANHRCEYCHAPEVVFNFPFEVEHIIPIAKRGKTDLDNLALACRSCNLRKSDRISGYLPDSNVEVNFFHPRQNQWIAHFGVNRESGEILGLTLIGRVTIDYLMMNSSSQLTARKIWLRLS